MVRHLLFQLHGPFASWGTEAVGEHRPTSDHPTKSAVMGLVGAALGLKRSEADRQRALASGHGFAVRVDRPGTVLEDFQTAQVPSGSPDPHWETRSDEIAGLEPDDNPVVSYREYRLDAITHVAMWPTAEDGPFALEEIGEALREPAFHVYLGRKSCPPALPFDPQIVEAGTLRDAFAAVEPSDVLSPLYDRDGSGEAVLADIYWEDHPDSGLDPDREIRRRDDPVDTDRRQFQARSEHHTRLMLGTDQVDEVS